MAQFVDLFSRLQLNLFPARFSRHFRLTELKTN